MQRLVAGNVDDAGTTLTDELAQTKLIDLMPLELVRIGTLEVDGLPQYDKTPLILQCIVTSRAYKVPRFDRLDEQPNQIVRPNGQIVYATQAFCFQLAEAAVV
jgi:hypothetical protein